MAHVEGQITKTIEKFLKNLFGNLAGEQTTETDDILNERKTNLAQFERNVEKHLDIISKLGSEILPMIREKVVDVMMEVKNRSRRITYELEKTTKTKVEFDAQLEDQLLYFEHQNEELDPSLIEIHQLIRAIDDFEMKIGGQSIIVSVGETPDLKGKTERAYRRIDLEAYRRENVKKIVEMRERTGKMKQEEASREVELRKKIDRVVSPIVSVLVERIGELNIPRNEIFQEFITAVEAISSVKIEIQEVMPDFDYDLLYANYLQASEDNDLDLLRSIGIQVFPGVDFFRMGVREVKQYLETNYFR
jgi:hypothetical protein